MVVCAVVWVDTRGCVVDVNLAVVGATNVEKDRVVAVVTARVVDGSVTCVEVKDTRAEVRCVDTVNTVDMLCVVAEYEARVVIRVVVVKSIDVFGVVRMVVTRRDVVGDGDSVAVFVDVGREGVVTMAVVAVNFIVTVVGCVVFRRFVTFVG